MLGELGMRKLSILPTSLDIFDTRQHYIRIPYKHINKSGILISNSQAKNKRYLFIGIFSLRPFVFFSCMDWITNIAIW